MERINTMSEDSIDSGDPLTTIQIKSSTRDTLRGLPGTYDQILSTTFKDMATTKPSTKEEGVVFVSSSGSIYTAPTIDADKIVQFLENPYLRSALNSYMNIIFPAPVEVEVTGPDEEIDEVLTKQFKSIVNSPNIRLNELMKKAYWNRMAFGCGILNPVWKRDGNEILPDKFRILPSDSFDTAPDGYDEVYSSIMQGVVINDKGKVEVWQRTDSMSMDTTQIKNFYLVKDPMDSGLAGDSRLVPLIAILDMLKYCWNTEMQACNRAGSPIVFIKVAQPQGPNKKNGGVGDVDYANKIIKNWSVNKQYQLRENMEVVTVDTKGSKNILDTITVLEQVINDYFSPTKLISKDGSHPLGSSGPELQLLNQAIQSEHRWLEDQFEQLLNKYFEYNAYPEGYQVHLHIPIIEPDQSELHIQQVDMAIKGRAVDLDDIRAKLGFDPVDDEKRAKIAEFWQSQQPAQAPTEALPFKMKEHSHSHDHEPLAFRKHPYVKAIEETEELIDGALKDSLESMSDKIMEAVKESVE